MNAKDRSVSNNDDVVHVLDKSKASAMYEKREGRTGDEGERRSEGEVRATQRSGK
jgi:hypothetical protein